MSKIGILVALMIAVPVGGHAADGPPLKYAVMSLIGDSLTVVADHRVTGSLLNRNGLQTMDLSSPVIDQTALLAADDALHKRDSSVTTVLLQSASPELRERQSQLVDGARLGDSSILHGVLDKSGANQFFLITKHRADAALQTDRSTLGSGTLYGLGFYIDRHTNLFEQANGQRAKGYLAPYVYFNVYLIDLATANVIGERTITASQTISNAKNDVSSDPWDILDSGAKIKVLEGMVRNQVMRAVTSLTQSPPPPP